MMSYAEDADPRFSDKEARRSDSRRRGDGLSKPKKQPRIAFTGEEFGFGFQATDSFLRRARQKGGVADGGQWAVSHARTEREFDPASPNAKFDYETPASMPLRTKEQTLLAVKQNTADFAVVPFYSPYFGYDFESLRALASLFTLLGVEQVEATDNLCLAVHESQLYDIIQSAHPGSGFSALQRRFRKSWGTVDSGSGNGPGGNYDAEMPRAGLPIDMADQKLIRDRIDMVFAGPEAVRRCKSKLDGLKALGVEVQELSQMIEPHRELARLARSTASTDRQTNTFFDPITGETRFFSTLGAEAQGGKLFGMVLPYEVAMRSSDYVIIDHNIDDAPPSKTRFLVVEQNPDHTLYEDAYRTTDAKTRYWMRRMSAIAQGGHSWATGIARASGAVVMAAALTLIFFGLVGATDLAASFLSDEITKWLTPLRAQTAIVVGTILGLFAWVFLTTTNGGERGVRVMMRFRRDGAAASIGDVENFLRNYGVRHAVVRMDEDSEREAPASVMLDVEFDGRDFIYNPITMMTRRLRGSVANGAIKKAFQKWKNRGVTVLAAMPVEPGQAQLPPHGQRRWWFEAVGALIADFTETMFIRLSRALIYIIPAAFLLYLLWTYFVSGGQ